eukprot:14753663-Alexandrium_andersonii.AAC.1
MSASLVGSEMCIRDRPVLGPAVRCALRAALPPRWRWRAVLTLDGGPAPSCLLYTSDAADDM